MIILFCPTDTNSDGVLDEAEIEALFQKEVSLFWFPSCLIQLIFMV